MNFSEPIYYPGCVRRTHGMTGSVEYRAWRDMLNRCYWERHISYSNYGGRGVVVCERWRNSFEAFVTDMGMKPSPDLSLDRIDNDGDYTPGNCRWATRTEQSANRRNAHRITAFGETLSITEWSKRTGVGSTTILMRIKRGWTPERAVAAHGN